MQQEDGAEEEQGQEEEEEGEGEEEEGRSRRIKSENHSQRFGNKEVAKAPRLDQKFISVLCEWFSDFIRLLLSSFPFLSSSPSPPAAPFLLH